MGDIMSKKTNKVNKANYSNDTEIGKLIKMVVIVTIIFLIFYLITAILTKKEDLENPKQPTTIQYDIILAGNILNQPPSEYYVLIASSDDEQLPSYNAYLSNYKTKDNAIRVYNVELNNPLNKMFVGEKSNFKINSIEDLKISGSVLIKVKNKKIVEHYENDSLKDKLIDISKAES